jgi:hypothetical protein
LQQAFYILRTKLTVAGTVQELIKIAPDSLLIDNKNLLSNQISCTKVLLNCDLE